jgi:hypothetical protein
MSAAWQGKGTWRFKGAAAAAKASQLAAGRAARGGRTAGRALDFEGLPARPEFRPGSRKTTCLGRRLRPKRAKAPLTTSYDVRQLLMMLLMLMMLMLPACPVQGASCRRGRPGS